MRKDSPHGVGLPLAIPFGWDERLIEDADNRAQRSPVDALLLHHPDRRLLGVVLHELVVDVVKAERNVASPGRSVSRGMLNRSSAFSTPERLAPAKREISRAESCSRLYSRSRTALHRKLSTGGIGTTPSMSAGIGAPVFASG